MKGKLLLGFIACLFLFTSCSKEESTDSTPSTTNPDLLDLSGNWAGIIQGQGTSLTNCPAGLLSSNETITFITNGSTITVNGIFPSRINNSLTGTLSGNTLTLPFNGGSSSAWDFLGGSLDFSDNSAFVRCTLQSWASNQPNTICSTYICSGTITKQ